MKRTLITLFLIAFTIKSFSQDSKLNFELNFPYPFDHNFIADNYDGIIDVGAKYRFVNSKKINIGISLNINIMNNNSEINKYYGNLKIKSYLIQPKIFTELNLKRFHPFIGIGYASMIFNSSISDENIAPLPRSGNYRDGFSVNNTQSGIDLSTGLQYDINKRILIQVQYDYIILSQEEPIINSKYNTNVNLLKFGFGYRI
ncbi:hypothetical protein HNQ02_003857 [Flavobacterium sp. 7E]|uniref:outer membrane beta-barrel protein n=1 Tax=Flavobacterium sp. 7E TaxID=2735898 RepID=UPI00156F872F|nr:outer membrane beta-barrel protein [Flavobacterium sp. 7E]NRS90906.1 hypothetical protein [Flavobacterium sp. 7E]